MTEQQSETPQHRYDAALADSIETTWQGRWKDAGTYHTPNPAGSLTEGPANGPTDLADRPKLFIMDMFPYPSGTGLHVGHPLGYISTDVYARFKRMTGFNVLHTMGYDAFGLPAEEHARSTGEHPRINTEANIANMSRQLARLGLGHDDRRSIATTDEAYYRWTQWIFSQIFNAWFDEHVGKARPISELEAEFASGVRVPEDGREWTELSAGDQRALINEHRLAYVSEAPVNWCPGLGTVLANEEVTAEGLSDRGNFPVFRRPLRQWMMRITAYAERLIDDLDLLDWTDSIKTMQRHWIGRSEGAHVEFRAPTALDADGEVATISVFTTRPDTLFGATYMVVAPEHSLVSSLTAEAWPQGTKDAWTGGAATPARAIEAYQRRTSQMSDLDRQENKEKTGVFTGSFAVNPVNDQSIPVFIADYVLMGYGTGAIMAVPGQDERDWDFAKAFDLDILRTVQPPADFDGDAYTGTGAAINSGFLDGMEIDEAKSAMIEHLDELGAGEGTVTTKLRDWLFARQRYWGEPIPIVFDDDGNARSVPDDYLPVNLPELIDWAPRELDEDSEPEPPLGRADGWTTVELDLGDGVKTYKRDLNTMPQWAGSCWYYLRYIDPVSSDIVADPTSEKYWMGGDDPESGGVDLYVGGVEHAVLHLLYSRFWHKVLYDLGHVSTPEPFKRLINQGYIQAHAFVDDRGMYVEAADVVEAADGYAYQGGAVTREYGKMGKSLKNSVTPDDMYRDYGADTLRLYEMFMGPIDQDRPWETKSVVGSQRLLQRIWRNLVDEDTGELTVADIGVSDDLNRSLNRTIDAVQGAMDALSFNTSIARITELNNELTKLDGPTPTVVANALVRLIAPLVPHIAEELWSKMGHESSVVYADFPTADPAWLVDDELEIPVQIKGKLRSRITIAADADAATMQAAALADPRIAELLEGLEVRKVIVIPGKLVNIVA
ncbi:MAG: leucyl-tRNA synthetase [Verrucomicrobiales bacterium]